MPEVQSLPTFRSHEAVCLCDRPARAMVPPSAERLAARQVAEHAAGSADPKIVVRDFTATFSGKPVVKNLNLEVHPHERLAIIGPASGGKTTFLRSLNRLNDLTPEFGHSGEILLDGQDVYDRSVDVAALRRRVGMVYAVPVPLPWSIYDNLVYGLKLMGLRNRNVLNERVEKCLQDVVLWDEVKDRLAEPATNLSGGQQQRLCIARVLALEPEVLILDEPCSGLDPISTAKIEDALLQLRSRHSIILVANNTKQAGRASDRTAFFLMGELVEVGPTDEIFTRPRDRRTNDYLVGQFG